MGKIKIECREACPPLLDRQLRLLFALPTKKGFACLRCLYLIASSLYHSSHPPVNFLVHEIGGATHSVKDCFGINE